MQSKFLDQTGRQMTTQTLKCVVCDKEIPENARGRKKKYCSNSCRNGSVARPETMCCIVCGEQIPNTKKYCSKVCFNVVRRQKTHKKRKKGTFTRCFSCSTFIPNDDRKVPCCNDVYCRQDWWKRNPPPPVPADWEPKGVA